MRAPASKVKNLKEPSGPSLYETFAVDAYSSPKKVPHFAQYVDMPQPDEDFGMRCCVSGVTGDLASLAPFLDDLVRL